MYLVIVGSSDYCFTVRFVVDDCNVKILGSIVG